MAHFLGLLETLKMGYIGLQPIYCDKSMFKIHLIGVLIFILGEGGFGMD